MSPPRIRVAPEDFVVDEIPLYEPSGSGAHTWCRVEKRLRNTDDVVARLASLAGVARHAVGFAGRKDRRAVTRQWFSVPDCEPARVRALADDGLRVLEAIPHRHRLHLGDLLGNRFRIRVREVDDAEAAAARRRWDDLVRRGLPNRFGAQRFGRDGQNPERGRRVLAGDRGTGPPRLARLFVAALQSLVFNEILRRRPAARDGALAGDLLFEHASGALRPVLDPADWAERLDSFEVSASAPLFGPKARRAAGLVGRLEAAVGRELGVPDPLPDGVARRLRISGGRRPVRVPVTEAGLVREAEGLQVSFVLPPGSYASVLLDEILGDGYLEVGRVDDEESDGV